MPGNAEVTRRRPASLRRPLCSDNNNNRLFSGRPPTPASARCCLTELLLAEAAVSTHEAFLAAVLETPDDDTPRLIYADWLDEHGEPERGELIRLQCALAKMREGERARVALEKREREL